MKIDMHIHTIYSDGDYTPRQVVDLAQAEGLDVIAITDHDESRGFGDIADDMPEGLRVFAGIEISATHGGQVHVLGLGIDPRDSGILAHVMHAQIKRKTRATRMIERLQASGIDITMDEVEAACGGCIIGRPHFATVLVAKGYASSHKEAFSRYLARHAPFYVPLERVSVAHAADMINSAGGKVVLAHPGLISGSVLNDLVPQLKELGFWGIEAYHPSHSNGQCREFESTARAGGLYVSAGSDFHGSVKSGIRIGQEQRGGDYLAHSMDAFLGQH